jgi:hypothetical protein
VGCIVDNNESSDTTSTSSTTTTTTHNKTAQEIHYRAGFNSCNRCGRDLGPLHERNISYRRYIQLTIPPEEGRVRPKEYHYAMCQWCVTAFLKFMKEKQQQQQQEKPKG